MIITSDSDAARQKLIVANKQSLREAQRTQTWEQRVAAIARMNAANKIAGGKLRRGTDK